MMETQNEVHDVSRLLSDLARAGFSGSLEIKLENGRITLVRKTETLLTEDDNSLRYRH